MLMCVFFVASVFYLTTNHFQLAVVSLLATILYFVSFFSYNVTKGGANCWLTGILPPITLFAYSQLTGENSLSHLFFLHIPITAFTFNREANEGLISKITTTPVLINLSVLILSLIFFIFGFIEPELDNNLIETHRSINLIMFSVLTIFFIHGYTNTLATNYQQTSRLLGRESKKLSEYKINQSSQIKALGAGLVRSFASGIAHEINNPLAVLRGASSQLQLKDISAERREKLLQMIARSSTRIDSCVSTLSLLTHNYKDITNKKKLHLQDASAYLEELLNETFGLPRGTIRVNLINDNNNPPISLTILESTILPLVKNATEATPSSDWGTIKIVIRQSGMRSVVIQVIDNGSGINDADSDRIFLPFESSKFSPKHNGLGLTSVNYIVNQVGGSLALKSKKSPTIFEISIPL